LLCFLHFLEIGRLNNDALVHVIPNDKTELRKLQDEINTLTKKNCELENLLIRKENNSIELKDCLDGNVDSNKLKELEKNYRQLKQEKDELHKVIMCLFPDVNYCELEGQNSLLVTPFH